MKDAVVNDLQPGHVIVWRPTLGSVVVAQVIRVDEPIVATERGQVATVVLAVTIPITPVPRGMDLTVEGAFRIVSPEQQAILERATGGGKPS